MSQSGDPHSPSDFTAGILRDLEVMRNRIDTKEELCAYLGREFGEQIMLRGIQNEGRPTTGRETLIFDAGPSSIEWTDFPAWRLGPILYNALVLPGSFPYPRTSAASRPIYWAEHERRYQEAHALEHEMFAEMGFDSSGIDDEENADPVIGSPRWRPTADEKRPLAMCAEAERHDSLSAAEFYRAYRANHFAGCIGRPLNAHVVITWTLYGVDEREVFQADEDFRELFRKWITSKRQGAAYINVIERGAWVGLHSHFRCHVPESMKERFAIWLPQAVRKAAKKAHAKPMTRGPARPRLDKAVPFTELLDRARRAAGTPANALSVSVRSPYDNRGNWKDLAYTMKALNAYEATIENLRNLGYLLHSALHLPDRGDTTVPADSRRLTISRLLGPTSQSEWKNALIGMGVDANDLTCPIDRIVSNLYDLHPDKAECVYRTYGLTVSIRRDRPDPAAELANTFANMTL